MTTEEIAQRIWRDRCACRVLIEITTRVADDLNENPVKQMEVLYAVAYMLDLVAKSMEELHQALRDLEEL